MRCRQPKQNQEPEIVRLGTLQEELEREDSHFLGAIVGYENGDYGLAWCECIDDDNTREFLLQTLATHQSQQLLEKRLTVLLQKGVPTVEQLIAAINDNEGGSDGEEEWKDSNL